MNLALAIGIMIIAGFLAGRLAHWLRFPMITGYIIVGAVLSPSVANVISSTTVEQLDVFTSIALGIIAYSIGGRLHLDAMRKLERAIVSIVPLEAIGAAVVSVLAVTLVAPLFVNVPGATYGSVYLPMGLLVGALASATAPAAIMALVREYKADGPLTTILLSIVALDDAIAIILFSIALGICQALALGMGFSAYPTLLLPILKILGAIGIGGAFGFALVYAARLARERSLTLVLALGTIMLCVGVTKLLGMSEILANMVVGLVVINGLKSSEMLDVIDDIEDVVFAMFFVLAGLHFDLLVMKTAGILGIVITLVRFGGKYLGASAGAVISRSPPTVRRYLGLALLPTAGVALGLALLAQRVLPTYGALVFNAILAAVILNELIAPPLVKLAIFKANEHHVD